MTKLSRDAVSLAVSGLQKAIRRSDEARALQCAYAIWQHSRSRCYRRLWVILFEDVGRDKSSLEAFRDSAAEDRPYRDWQHVAELARLLARGSKSHASHFVVALAEMGRHELIQPPEVRDKVRIIVATRSFQAAVETDYAQAVAALAGYAHERLGVSWDMCGGAVAWADHDAAVQSAAHEDEDAPDRVRGPLYLSAIDGHTRPGKTVLATWRKQHGEALRWFGITTARDVKELHWGWLGSCHRHEIKPEGTPIKENIYRVKVPAILRAREWFVGQRDDLLDLASWALDHLCPDALAELEEAAG